MNYHFQSPYQTGPRTWGLYSKDSTVAIPLQSLDISVTIIHNVARIFYTQHYHNASQAALDTEFFFPISPDACFDSFQAKLGDKVITGAVRHKQEAQQQYTQAVQQGRTAAYSEINPDAGDVMKVLIGNIAPQSAIHITYSYVEQLTPSLGKFWCFRLFSCITPRYCGSLTDLLSSDVGLLSSYPTVSREGEGAYPWKIQVQIQSPSGLTAVKSPSHDIISEFGNEHHTCTVTLGRHYLPNKDFVLLFSNSDKIDHISSVMTPFEDGYCAMISMMADFDDKTSPEQAYDNFVKAKPVNEQHHSTSQIRGEYIFLLDRSGSMSGKRMDMAKSSLALFLKSLPKDSLFNVVSFGSNYSFMHTSSTKASQQSIDAACYQLESFQADMGGTEIYPCLNNVFSNVLKPGYPRFVFLMTDGDVTNTRQVLDLIKTHNRAANVFSVGIGSGCSVELITKSAFYGKGKYELVVDAAEIHEKVISLLKAALSPCLSDFSLHADNFDAVVKSVSPSPQSISSLLAGQMATFFVLLRKEAFDVTTHKMVLSVKVYDSKLQSHRVVQVVLDEREIIDNEMISKLAVHSMIDAHDLSTLDRSSNIQAVLWLQKEDIEKTLVALSVKYGVLCKQTAFICEVKEQGKVSMQSVEKIKVVVPSVSSADYSSRSGGLFSSNQGSGLFSGSQSGGLFSSNQSGGLFSSSQSGGLFSSNKSSGGLFSGGQLGGVSSNNQSGGLFLGGQPGGVSSNNQSGGGLFSSSQSGGLFSNSKSGGGLFSGSQSGGLSSNIPSGGLLSRHLSIKPANSSTFGMAPAPSCNTFGSNNQPPQSTGSQMFGKPQQSNPTTVSSFFSSTNNMGLNQFQNTPNSTDQKRSHEDKMDLESLANDFDSSSNTFGSTNQLGVFPNSSAFNTFNAFPNSSAQPQFKNTHSYLDVAFLQTFDGFWNPADNKLVSVVLRSPTLPQAPSQLQPTSTASINTLWMTLLVLVWLEKACQKDQKSWSLIHQKGCEWLKEQGIDYKAVKSLGEQYVRV